VGDSASSLVVGLTKSLATLLGVHLQYAQKEVQSDLARLIWGAALCLVGSLFAATALLVAHAAAVWALEAYVAGLDWLRALLVVAAADLVLGAILALSGVSRLRKPVLKQTRMLLRKTVTSMTDL